LSLSVALQLRSGLGRVTVEVSKSHTIRHTHTRARASAPLDEGSARRRDLYLTTHNTHKRHTSTPLMGSEPAIPASKRPNTHTLDHAAIGKGKDKT